MVTMKAQDFFLISLACFIVTLGQLGFYDFVLMYHSAWEVSAVFVLLIVTSAMTGTAFAITGYIKRYLEGRSSHA